MQTRMFDTARSIDEAENVKNDVKCWVCGMIIDKIGTLLAKNELFLSQN